MSSSPASFFVPTLDIDLVWHTHQLYPEKYELDCKNHLAKFIDQYVSYFVVIPKPCLFANDNAVTTK